MIDHPKNGGSAPVLLLVEDDELSRDMMSRRLRRRNFEVVVATNRREAVEVALAARPDLILMDIGLGPDDGLDVVQELRKIEDFSAIPIIALTAHAMISDQERSVGAGCTGFETKPVDFDRLLTKINFFLA